MEMKSWSVPVMAAKTGSRWSTEDETMSAEELWRGRNPSEVHCIELSMISHHVLI